MGLLELLLVMEVNLTSKCVGEFDFEKRLSVLIIHVYFDYVALAHETLTQ